MISCDSPIICWSEKEGEEKGGERWERWKKGKEERKDNDRVKYLPNGINFESTTMFATWSTNVEKIGPFHVTMRFFCFRLFC